MQHSQLLTRIDNTLRAKQQLVKRVIKSNEFENFTDLQQRQLIHLAVQMERQKQYILDGIQMMDENYQTIRRSLRKSIDSGEIQTQTRCIREMTEDTEQELLARFE